MTPQTAAARRWVAGQLAWEDRLGALRDASDDNEATKTTGLPSPELRRRQSTASHPRHRVAPAA
jgi:hypothetical protein